MLLSRYYSVYLLFTRFHRLFRIRQDERHCENDFVSLVYCVLRGKPRTEAKIMLGPFLDSHLLILVASAIRYNNYLSNNKNNNRKFMCFMTVKLRFLLK